MYNCHKNIDGFDNFSIGSLYQSVTDKLTTIKNNALQDVKKATNGLYTNGITTFKNNAIQDVKAIGRSIFSGGFASGQTPGGNFTVPDAVTLPNYSPSTMASAGLSGLQITGIVVGGLAFIGLVTAVIIKIKHKKV